MFYDSMVLVSGPFYFVLALMVCISLFHLRLLHLLPNFILCIAWLAWLLT